MEAMDLNDLFEELRAGNDRYLKAIFQDHAIPCMQWLMRRNRCPREDAEDIYVDAVMNLREKVLKREVVHLTNVRSYLLATCRNMFLEKLRRAKREQQALAELSIYQWSDDGSGFFRESLSEIALRALSRIGQKCQEILRQFYYYHLSMDEIAVKNGLASSNVAKVTKARCLAKLVDNVKSLQPSRLTENVT